MPVYEFQCQACKRRVEVLRKLGDYAAPSCCGPVEMLFSVPAVNVWNPSWRFPNLSTEGDGFATFDTESDYKSRLTELGAEESSLGVKEV